MIPHVDYLLADNPSTLGGKSPSTRGSLATLQVFVLPQPPT